MKKLFSPVAFDKKLGAVPRAIVAFLFGGVGYGFIEVLWRGRTHPSMILTGGACLVMIRALTHALKSRTVIFRCLVGTALITCVEFLVGCVVNRWLGLAVWDYSGMRYNVLGQICPTYTALWFCVSTPLVMIFSLAEQKTSKKRDKKLFHF
ncbi:MAG: hypothetical protein IKP68_00505 [Clostridia bacterium]|nr:hypothetical protein [Clostridia bacterium]MBR7083516.1 hypothetical protein [Clostridia bacterium]